MKVALPLLTAACLALSACGGSSSANSPATPATGTPSGGDNGQTEAPVNRFAASKGCYALQSPETGQFAVATADGYTLSTAELSSAEGFYMQPSNLGTYLLYTKDEKLLTANTGLTNAGTVTANDAASDDAIWALDISGDNASFIAENSGQQLQVNDNGELVIGEPGSEPNTLFALVPSSGCATYPEMPTGIIGDTYKGQGVNKPIVGFADVHTHMGMSSEMSYAGDVGPSAGGVLYGEVIHRFGVPHALEDCEDFHGPNGSRDANFILDQSTAGGHDTQGWPTFVDWPRRNYLTHQVMYYRWVERAYLAGLRLMVNHGTNIAALCRVGQSYAGRPDADCDDMGVAVKQVQYLYDVQDYIDAQHGGPGKGWYRIVKS
ncbi:MAG: peptidase M19, partial [Spongiibacter sp.]|nr:peptidase M19 [Spongiibacter sp.]